MKFNNVFLHSFGLADPDTFITSDQMEEKLAPLYQRLKLPEGRLELSTGIKSRGVFSKLRPSGISAKAAKAALERSSIAKEEINLFIHSSVCRDFLEPSTASVAHAELGLPPTCASFDLSNACLGFLDAIRVAGGQISAGLISNALIVTGENSRPLVDETISFLNDNLSLTRKSVKKYFANLTIGSAGVAYLLTNRPEGALAQITGSVCLSDTMSAHLCQGDGNTEGLMMETESEELLHAGVNLAQEAYDKFKVEVFESPDKVICHQVGVAHRNLLMDTLKIEKDKDFISYDRYGNTGSAACPLTLLKASEAGFLRSGDKVALLGIGSGLHTNMMGLEWK